MSDTEKERRELGRRDLSSFFPTVFIHQNQERRALLVNLSDTGGRFQPQYVHQELDLKVGDTLDLEIRTDKGILKVQSKISWIRKKEAYFSWGARFLNMDETKNKIIQAILSSNS